MEGRHFSLTHFMFFGEPKANISSCVLTSDSRTQRFNAGYDEEPFPRANQSLVLWARILELHHSHWRVLPVQDRGPIFLYHYHVFQSYPSPSGYVNPGFNRGDHTYL